MTISPDWRLDQLSLGDHVCLVYDHPTELLPIVGPFIGQGLARRERVLYAVGDLAIDQIAMGLIALGIDVPREHARGTLVFLTTEDYGAEGASDPQAMVGVLRRLCDEANADGFGGLRIVIEMTWTSARGVTAEQLLDYEARANEFFQARPALAVCQYRRSRLDPAALRAGLCTHPFVLLDRQLYPNLYYEPPALLPRGTHQAERVEWMLARLRGTQAGADEHPQRIREQAARAAAEMAQRRLAFLAEASARLASSLDYQATLSGVARLAVPELADWCVVDTLDPDGTIRLLALAHVDASKEPLVHELRRHYPPKARARYGLPKVLRTGRPELYSRIEETWRESAARDRDPLRLLQLLGARSSMCVPLVARGQTLGAMTFVLAGSSRHYDEGDLAFAQDLARRCALALDNARLYSQLQEALNIREISLASLAHDLRNPLAASRGYAQLLKQQIAGLGTGERVSRLADWAARIEAGTGRMARIVEELLDVARLESGQPLKLEREPTDLVALARQALAEDQQAAQRHQLRLDAHVQELVGLWDATRLERVLSNLLSNALKYSPEGSRVTVRLRQQGRWAVLQVRDSGLGIPATDLPRIFQRFYRASNVGWLVAGTGLGLAGVKQIVEQHGGKVTLRSQEGAGTTVTVRLPLADSLAVGGRAAPMRAKQGRATDAHPV